MKIVFWDWRPVSTEFLSFIVTDTTNLVTCFYAFIYLLIPLYCLTDPINVLSLSYTAISLRSYFFILIYNPKTLPKLFDPDQIVSWMHHTIVVNVLVSFRFLKRQKSETANVKQYYFRNPDRIFLAALRNSVSKMSILIKLCSNHITKFNI